MSDHMSWTPEELWDKADWEGGVSGLLEYGGPEIFTILGEEAVTAARQVNEGLRFLQKIFNQIEDNRTEVNDDF